MKKMKSENSPTRLPSLRGPRDLTLGGIKKKVFTPNIPIRKDKAKLETKPEKPAVKIKKENRSRSQASTSKGRRRGFKKNVIQSHSIFEARPDAIPKVQSRDSNVSRGEAQLEKPTIKKERYDSLKEKFDSDEAMRRLEEGNSSLIADLQNDEKLGPVVLPLHGDKIDNRNRDLTSNVFRSSNGDVILFQLPDTLPGIPPSNDEPPIVAKQESSDDVSRLCSIEQMHEGKIGKLQILKSGRCRLVLRDFHLHIKSGTSASFAQHEQDHIALSAQGKWPLVDYRNQFADRISRKWFCEPLVKPLTTGVHHLRPPPIIVAEIASIRLPPEGSGDEARGHVSVLGEVRHKMVCVPNMTTLIEKVCS